MTARQRRPQRMTRLLTPNTGAVGTNDTECTSVAVWSIGDDPFQYPRQDGQNDKFSDRTNEERNICQTATCQHSERVVGLLTEMSADTLWGDTECSLYLSPFQLFLTSLDLGQITGETREGGCPDWNPVQL